MIQTDRLLSLVIAVICGYGMFLVGMGRSIPLLSVGGVVVPLTALVVCDWLGWLRLHRHLATLAALLVAIGCLIDMANTPAHEQLGSISNFLIGLEIVLLIQAKTTRIYWQLLVLGLLQVIIAVALLEEAWLEVLVAAYVLLALAAMSLLTSSRGAAEQPGNQVAARDRRSQSSRGIAAQGVFVVAAAMALAGVLLGGVRRISQPVVPPAAIPSGPMTGYSGEVRFDEMERVLESERPVMRVWLRQAGSHEPVRMIEEPYFRGTGLDEYVSGRSGIVGWQTSGGRPPGLGGMRGAHWDSLEPPPAGAHVRQEYVMQPSRERLLFCIHPAFASGRSQSEIVRDRRGLRLYYLPQREGARTRDRRQRPARFSLGTTAIRDGRQLPLRASEGRERGGQLTYLHRWQFPRLIAKAEEVLDAQDLASAGPYERAKALERHFLTSGEYTYTLDFKSVKRDESMDAMEDFIGNHRHGHCEYFASALALMLRSQGIPSRLVIGYRGGEYNSVGDYFQVRERHAHAWVEAHLQREEIPSELLGQLPADASGAWLRLDPTPAGIASGEQTPLAQAGQMFDYLEVLWVDSFLEPASSGDGSNSSWDQRLQRMGETAGAQTMLWMLLGVAVLSVLYLALVFARRRLPGKFSHAGSRRRQRLPEPQIPFYRRLVTLLAAHGIHRESGHTPREFAAAASGRLATAHGGGELDSDLCTLIDAYYRVRFGGEALAREQLARLDSILDRLEPLGDRPWST